MHKYFSKLSLGAAIVSTAMAFAAFAPVALADQDPASCDSTGVTVTMTVFRSDGVTPVGSGTVTDGEVLKYRATLAWAGGSNCAFQGGTWLVTDPHGTATDVTPGGGVPRIGDPASGTGAISSLNSALVSYTVLHADEALSGGQKKITATTNYSGGTAHDSSGDSPGVVSGSTGKTNTVVHTPTVSTDIHDANHVATTSVSAGTTVHDKALVTGASNSPTPTGTVSFTRYTASGCEVGSTDAGSHAVDVNGVADGSNTFAPVSAGTLSYKAHYNGDTNYSPADGPCENLTITKANPSVSTDIHNVSEQVVTSVNAGATVHDKATVSGSQGTPTGTVDFMFWNNGTCNSVGAAAGTGVVIDGSGVAHPSSSEGPLGTGSYSFRAHYNGDNTYNTADGPCEPLTVSALTPQVTTDIHDDNHGVVTSVLPGASVHDKATVAGGNGNPTPTGNVDFTWYTNGSCTPEGSPAGTGVVLDGNGVAHPSSTEGPLAPGSYSFRAHYNGDGNYAAANGPCEQLTVSKVDPTVHTDIHSAAHAMISSANAGDTVHDSATVSGGSGTPTGTVTFDFFTNGACSSVAAASSGALSLASGSVDATGFAQVVAPTAASFKAHYSGDSTYNAKDGSCEPLTVSKINTTTHTDIHNAAHAVVTSVLAGTSVHDNAQVSPSAATGNVSFALYSNGTCTGDPVSSQGVALAAGVAESSATTANSALSYKASYAGDNAYNGSVGDCEPLTVQHPSTVLHINSNLSQVSTGGTVTLTITEQNDGDVPLTNPHVDLDNGLGTLSAPPTSGDTGNDGILGVGETWTWTKVTNAINAQTTFTATGHGLDPNQQDVTFPGDQQEQASVTVKVASAQGCSPGYWKQSQHFSSYPAGVTPNSLFTSVGFENAFPGKTLLQVLSTGGGGLTALGRIITGAYLNASTITGFPYSGAQVVADFNAVFPGTTTQYDALKAKYEALQDPCPLGGGGKSGSDDHEASLSSSDDGHHSGGGSHSGGEKDE